MDVSPGQVIKGYELREPIGVGGFGAVFRAFQPLVQREVAVKIVLPQFANDPRFVRNFEAEAQLIARLEHLNIVPLYDFWREPGGAFLIMRWLRGGSLQKSLERNGAWSLDEAARLLDQITAALAVAHRQQVIHRDIKPANILLDEDRNAYLTDFGIAKDLTTKGEEEEDALIGSPAYISPEQIQGLSVTPQSDIYGLGIVLYEVLTGQRPFQGDNISAMLMQHVLEPIPSLKAFASGLPPALDQVIQRATAKDPLSRYGDVRQFAAEFRRALASSQFSGPADSLGQSSSTLSETLDLGLLFEAPLQTSDLSAKTLDELDLIDTVHLQIINPYKGLRAFQGADSADFFGRDGLVNQVIERLAEPHRHARFLAIVGPSGSGKSSVAKAGLLPRLRAGALPGSLDWFFVEMVPGNAPLDNLLAALLSIAVNPPPPALLWEQDDPEALAKLVKAILPDDDSEIVLLIDQFEEVFTQSADETQRQRFLQRLQQATVGHGSRLRTVITLRADFYDRPLLYPEFGQLMRQRTEVVLPLNATELGEAISKPAERVGFLSSRIWSRRCWRTSAQNPAPCPCCNIA
ncbi:MAG: serine/threonine-protein kinase PknK [Anaerolineae bacterium]|nr:serine/threonine-protein kinase PknK [Anaerolineae bacterium]